jgi:hypothetical protein
MTFEEWFDAARGEHKAEDMPVEIYNVLKIAYYDGYRAALKDFEEGLLNGIFGE